jgi:hypothetical protein
MQLLWKACSHGSVRNTSPSSNDDRQILHLLSTSASVALRVGRLCKTTCRVPAGSLSGCRNLPAWRSLSRPRSMPVGPSVRTV